MTEGKDKLGSLPENLNREEVLAIIQRMRARLDSIETAINQAREGLDEVKQELEVTRIFGEIADELNAITGTEIKNHGENSQ